jgi:hypothetical protein
MLLARSPHTFPFSNLFLGVAQGGRLHERHGAFAAMEDEGDPGVGSLEGLGLHQREHGRLEELVQAQVRRVHESTVHVNQHA